MNLHQEFWDELTTEIGNLDVETNKVLKQINVIEEKALARDRIQIEFYAHRRDLIKKINALETQIIDLQRWINLHVKAAGSRVR
jgi:hypothetical protein